MKVGGVALIVVLVVLSFDIPVWQSFDSVLQSGICCGLFLCLFYRYDDNLDAFRHHHCAYDHPQPDWYFVAKGRDEKYAQRLLDDGDDVLTKITKVTAGKSNRCKWGTVY